MNYSDFAKACKANEVRVVSRILEAHPDYINIMNTQKESLLVETAKQNHFDMLKLLIDKGGDVNAVDSSGWSALVWASKKGLVEVAKLLLASGATVDGETAVEDTALIKASNFGQDAIVSLLVAYGAEVNKQDRAGTCALINACAKCSAATVQLLIDAGARIDCINSYSVSPYSAACNRGDEEIISILDQAEGKYLMNQASPPTITTLVSESNTTLSVEVPNITSIRIRRADISLEPAPISYTACSTVYRGKYRHTPVAVKMIRHHISSQAMQTEIKVLSELRHPRVLMLLGVVNDVLPHEGCVALVTEYMFGGSLDTVLHLAGRNMKLSNKIRIMLDVADGMRFLHTSRVLHRDLKTSNILLDHEHRAKVGDFGHSTILDPTMSQVTGDVTTIAYASPESLGDRKEVGFASDVYSFGVVLWEVVSGQLPWDGFTFAQIATKISRGETLPRLEVSETCPPLLVELIAACFRIPDERPLFAYIYDLLLTILDGQIDVEKTIHFPIEFMCPIGRTIMRDPVQCFDGHTYERCNIEKWLSLCQISPLTRQKLDNITIVPNYSLKSTIEAYLQGKLIEKAEFGNSIGEL